MKLWASQGVPVTRNGIWVTKTTRDLGEAMDWAAVEVERRRPKVLLGGAVEAPC